MKPYGCRHSPCKPIARLVPGPGSGYDSALMNEPATQPDTLSAAAMSPCPDLWHRFFFFTADSERILT